MKYLYQGLTEKIIKAYYNVYNEPGYGFLEKVYENALMIELRSLRLNCEKQKPISVSFKGYNVGEYFTDIIVENKVIIELKAAEGLVEEHEVQLLNYLKATEIEVGFYLTLVKNLNLKERFLRTSIKNQFKSVRSVRSAFH